MRDSFLEIVQAHPVVIVIGETGSGKSTQIPQYLYEAGFSIWQPSPSPKHETRESSPALIGCTQPRRVAAISVSQRVAYEMNCELGTRVGYAIRFDDRTSPETCIQYMTDGMLLREASMDPLLSRYRVIVLDEAHERTVNTDVLLALLNRLIVGVNASRPDLKLIVTSATLDTGKFSRYFGDAPVFEIPGSAYPVDTLWCPIAPCGMVRRGATDYVNEALELVLAIHRSEPPGDILVFLTGQEDVDAAVDVLQERLQNALSTSVTENTVGPLQVLSIYSSMPSDQQTRSFGNVRRKDALARSRWRRLKDS